MEFQAGLYHDFRGFEENQRTTSPKMLEIISSQKTCCIVHVQLVVPFSKNVFPVLNKIQLTLEQHKIFQLC